MARGSLTVSDLSLGIGDSLDLNDVKWDVRALGCECSEPVAIDWPDREEGDAEWEMDITTGSLSFTLYNDRTVHITDTDSDLLWSDSVEWKLIALIMRLIGAVTE